MGMCDIAALMATLTVMLLQPGASQVILPCKGCLPLVQTLIKQLEHPQPLPCRVITCSCGIKRSCTDSLRPVVS